MNKLILITVSILHLVVFIKTATLPRQKSVTLLDYLNATKHYKTLECTDLRTMLLNETRFAFLKECPSPENVQSNNDMLCVIFANNFVKLCNSSRPNFDIKILLNESSINSSLVTSKINDTCDHLKTTEAVGKTFNSTVSRINKFMEIYCPAMCMDFRDNSTYPICSLSMLLNVVIKQRIDRVQQSNKADVKEETVITQVEEQKPTKVSKPASEQKSVEETKPPLIEPPKPPVPDQSSAPKAPTVQKPPTANQNEVKEKPSQDHEQPQKKTETEEKVVDENKKEINKISPEETPVEADVKDIKSNDAVETEAEVNKQEENPNNKAEIRNESQDNQYDSEDDVQISKDDEVPEPVKKTNKPKPKEINEDDIISANANNSSQIEEEDSFFFVYFMMVCAVFILGYIGYHNKQKVLALVIEGRRGRRTSRRGGRPNSANYHKLDSNLEEAVTSAVHKTTTNIIY